MARTWTLRSTAADLVERYLAEGLWTDDTLGELLDRQLRDETDLEFRIWSRTRPWRGTMGDVYDGARTFAGWLGSQGVEPGDVVAFQLPNCVEAAVVFWGSALAGVVLVPIVHFYGPKEVGFILDQLHPEVLVHAGADLTGHEDPNRRDLLVDLSAPAGADGTIDFVDSLGATPLDGPVHLDPDRPALIAFTSGTTADPKGVIHTHRSIVAETRQLAATQPPDPRQWLIGAPVGHAIGMLGALLTPVQNHREVHLVDLWNPPDVLAFMLEGDLASGSGATFFLTSLLDAPECGPEHLEQITYVGLGGSAVPEAVADRAIGLGISIVRAYGATEIPSVTSATHDEPQDLRKRTDGHPLAGVELRIVDPDGNDLPAGELGEIWTRGPELFAGYTDPALNATVIDDEGWYHTGDVGIVDEDGWLEITDRLADVIIRGGENISAVEVENALVQLPGVAEAAVVAAPDQRLGEHACAFLRMLDPAAAAPDLDAVRTHLDELGLAKQKWPEEVRAVMDLPRTPSGKVRKADLRADLRAETT